MAVEQPAGALQLRPRLGYPVGVVVVVGAQAVADYLLHRRHHLAVEDAVPEPRLQGGGGSTGISGGGAPKPSRYSTTAVDFGTVRPVSP